MLLLVRLVISSSMVFIYTLISMCQMKYLITRLLFNQKGSGWKIVASFEGKFPDRIKQLPLDRHFDINNVKRVNSKALLELILEWAHFAYDDYCYLYILDCPGSRWLSTIFDISRERFKILNKRST